MLKSFWGSVIILHTSKTTYVIIFPITLRILQKLLSHIIENSLHGGIEPLLICSTGIWKILADLQLEHGFSSWKTL